VDEGQRPTSRMVVDLVRALRGWVVAIAGGVLLLGAYLGISAETDPGRQLPYLVSGGFGGIALVILGSALLVADRIDASREAQARVASQVNDLHTLIVEATGGETAPPAGSGPSLDYSPRAGVASGAADRDVRG
jgi:hypothetical protein